jgi:hypothetical protein
VTTRADIQKNTLQVKVAITQPPAMITPEMLAQVTFLAPRQAKDVADTSHEPLRLLIPRNLVIGADGSSSVWIVDPVTMGARRQSIHLGKAGTEELVEVAQGLDPTAKLIVSGRESLSDGSRVRITGEDSSQAGWPNSPAPSISENNITPRQGSVTK